MGSRSLVFGAVGALMLLLAALLADGTPIDRGEAVRIGASQPSSSPLTPGGGDDLERLLDWASGRFSRAGLAEPDVDRFALAACDDCDERLGWVSIGADGAFIALRDDLPICCAGYRGVTLFCDDAKRCLLHELSHVWIENYVDADTRDRFMAHTGAAAWNDPASPWHARGVEQAAETLAWVLLVDPTVPPAAPKETCLRRVTGYEILTGRSPEIDCRSVPLPPVPR